MDETTGMPRAVATADFETAVLARSAAVPVMVDFWAAWCGPCRALAPVVDRIAAAYAGRADVVKVDTDAEPELASRYGVRSLPTIAVFRNGALVDAVIGAQPEGVLREMLDRHVDRPSDAEREAALVLARGGDVDAAVATLTRLVEAEPDRTAHFYALLDVLLDAGLLDAAAARLGHVPAKLDAEPEVARRRARLDLLRAAADASADAAAGADAAKRFLAGDEEAALEAWLTAMRTVRERDAAQRLLRAAFTLIGDEQRIAPWRRRMASLLH